MCLSADKVFMLEDKIMRQPGLYLMWTVLFLVNLICLSVDSYTDFLVNLESWIILDIRSPY